jgi:hypothetical protein
MPSNSWCATQQPGNHAAGISRSSRQRIAAKGQVAPGACLPEHLQGLIEGSPLAPLALGPAGAEIRLQPCRC